MAHDERRRGEYIITTDLERLDEAAIHAYLSRSYWARGISRELVARSIRGSLCFGLLHAGVDASSGERAGAARSTQVGFARVVTDSATFAYLCDVYVLEEHRGRGLAQWLLRVVMDHPGLAGLRRFVLATRDAHGLYERYGFTPLANPQTFMEIARPGLYQAPADGGAS